MAPHLYRVLNRYKLAGADEGGTFESRPGTIVNAATVSLPFSCRPRSSTPSVPKRMTF
jgi:hypothetical protein